MSADSEENTVGTILRLANVGESYCFQVITVCLTDQTSTLPPGERQHLPVKHEKEQELLHACLHFAHGVHRLPMRIVGAEHQFDGRQLTVFYTSDSRIDFRLLVKDLYALYKTHVWMRKISQCAPFVPKQFAAIALATGVNMCEQQLQR